VKDITQFVGFKEFKYDGEQLAFKVLDVFQKQFMEYMASNSIMPREVLKVSLSSIVD
jgi:hypothetical protein